MRSWLLRLSEEVRTNSENKDMKLRVFKELDAILKKEAVIASNTSQYTIADLAA